uniref:Ig-like domain-containing protein n=1 Tax=Cyprinus carpio TaxID=7962 RepID=A0A8C1FXA4_CYPCA
MIRTIISLIIALLSDRHICASKGIRLFVLMAAKGSDVQLNCTHKKDSTFVQMYWYRQRPGQTMTLIVFTSTLNSKHDYESGSLTVNNVESDDSAVYFCSVSKHTVQ